MVLEERSDGWEVKDRCQTFSFMKAPHRPMTGCFTILAQWICKQTVIWSTAMPPLDSDLSNIMPKVSLSPPGDGLQNSTWSLLNIEYVSHVCCIIISLTWVLKQHVQTSVCPIYHQRRIPERCFQVAVVYLFLCLHAKLFFLTKLLIKSGKKYVQ